MKTRLATKITGFDYNHYLMLDEWDQDTAIQLFAQKDNDRLRDLIEAGRQSGKLECLRSTFGNYSDVPRKYFYEPFIIIHWALSKPLPLPVELVEWHDQQSKPEEIPYKPADMVDVVSRQPTVLKDASGVSHAVAEPTILNQTSNDLKLSGLLNNLSRINDWFSVIDDMTKGFYTKMGYIPNEAQAWGALWTSPPEGYEITTGTDRGEDILKMPGVKALSKSAFSKRWTKYTANNPQ